MALFLLAFAVQDAHEQLKPLSWISGMWEGSGKYGDHPFEETVTYEWTHNRNFIKVSAEARMGGKVVHAQTGMIGYDRAKKKLVTFSFTMDGTIGTGEALLSEEKNSWVFTVRIGEDPPWNDAVETLRKVDDNTFTTEVKTKKDEKYVTFFRATYKRKKD